MWVVVVCNTLAENERWTLAVFDREHRSRRPRNYFDDDDIKISETSSENLISFLFIFKLTRGSGNFGWQPFHESILKV